MEQNIKDASGNVNQQKQVHSTWTVDGINTCDIHIQYQDRTETIFVIQKTDLYSILENSGKAKLIK